MWRGEQTGGAGGGMCGGSLSVFVATGFLGTVATREIFRIPKRGANIDGQVEGGYE